MKFIYLYQGSIILLLVFFSFELSQLKPSDYKEAYEISTSFYTNNHRIPAKTGLFLLPLVTKII